MIFKQNKNQSEEKEEYSGIHLDSWYNKSAMKSCQRQYTGSK